MTELALKWNEEMVKQESLPEPVLVIWAPPPPLLPAPGQLTMPWSNWLRAFENYIEALGEKDLVESTKCVLLQNCIGLEGQRIFTVMMLDEETYVAAISMLTAYFQSDSIAQMHLLKFHQRAQLPEETVEEFVSALDELLKPCNCGNLRDRLIVNQLIKKTSYPQLRTRLLLDKETLSLSTALSIGKEMEDILNRSRTCRTQEVSVTVGDALEPLVMPRVKRKRGRPRCAGKRMTTTSCMNIAVTKSVRPKKNFSCCSDKRTDEHNRQLKARDSLVAGANDDKEASLSPEMKKEDANVPNHGDKGHLLPSVSKLKGPYCPICINKRFRDANKLARHMRTHTKEKPFSCPLCSTTFSQSYHLTRHLRNQHGTNPHVCPTCGKCLETFAELQKHKITHKVRLLTCNDCLEVFTDGLAFSVHVASHIQTAQTLQQSLPACDATGVKSESVLKEDVASSNGDTQEKADEDIAQNSEAAEAEQDQQKEKDVITTKKDYSCPICVNRQFTGSNKLARHMRMHTKEKPFSCPVCALTFSQSYHMTRHVRKQHDLGQHICTKCGISFNSWLELKTHRKTHAIEGLTCFACNTNFKGKSSLVSHLKTHKSIEKGSRNLTCSDCGREFGRLYHLKRHIVTHRKATVGEFYICPDCQKSFAFPEDLNKHLEIHVKDNKGTCPKCHEVFGSLVELEEHMVVHQKSYNCSTCGKKFKVEYALKKHEQTHEHEQYYCSLCCKHFLKLSHYKRHIVVHKKRESRCPHCPTVFLQLTAFKYHLRTHTEERPHQCSCCIETFEAKDELEKHCLKHRKLKKQRPYSCSRCDNAFTSLDELTEHMTTHEGEQPLACPVCSRTFLNKSKFERHLTIHTGERPHLCSVCGNGFPSAASLNLHFHVHTGEKLFQCPQCNKSFRTSSGLRLHSRQHMEAPPSYECPECGRTYGRMTELRMHQRYHTGDKPYACSCCSKRFISKDKLNVHMRIHTGERPYSCPHCGQTFTQTGDRNRHISKHHQLA